MAVTLTHLAFHVEEFDACVDFYRSYCGMNVVHSREVPSGKSHVVWLAEPGREHMFIFVLIPGGKHQPENRDDFSHLGFAVESRKRVDEIADRARREGHLIWEPVEEPYPVGYYCGVRDPDGNQVEFSFGQPLGPGAPKPDAE